VKEKVITDHAMHRESFSLNEEAVSTILETKAEGGRVIAVGTTSCRVLESVAHRLYEGTGEKDSLELFYPCMGETELFIYPGFDFRAVDSMITNFHLPGSTLLMLVSAFMGREKMLYSYRTAVDMNYRFFSFGDAMFLEPVRERE
jgi:S-adenosylmethionine:tRNA ribosyltransferase-isomerase